MAFEDAIGLPGKNLIWVHDPLHTHICIVALDLVFGHLRLDKLFFIILNHRLFAILQLGCDSDYQVVTSGGSHSW